MLEAIKKQIRVQWDAWVLGIVIVLVGVLFGIILLGLVVRFDEDTTTCFQLGTLMGMILAVFYSGLVVIGLMQFYFNLEVSMRCTRKEFFVSYFVLSFLENLVNLVILIGVAIGENKLYPVFYPALDCEYNFLPVLLKAGVPAALAVPMVAGLCGALILRYGKKAGWTFWGVWMFACIGGPKILDASVDAPDSLFGRLGNGIMRMVQTVPIAAWIGIAAVFSIGCLIASYLLIRKQAVTV